MSAPIFLWDPVLSEAWPNSVEQADEYRIQLREVGHDHSPRVDHFAELLKAKVAAEKPLMQILNKMAILKARICSSHSIRRHWSVGITLKMFMLICFLC